MVALARQELDPQPNLQTILCDLRETPELPGPFDAAIHCAATSPGPGIADEMILTDNIEGGLCLLRQLQAAGCAKFVFLSSLSVHGDIDVASVSGDTPISNPDAYGRSKHAIEVALAEYAKVMPSVSIRLPGIVGPGAARNWLTQVKAKAQRDDDIAVFNPDAPYNNIVHVDELVSFVATLVGADLRESVVCPVGADGKISVREAVELLVATMESTSRMQVDNAVRNSFTIDNTAALALGYEPLDVSTVIKRYAKEPC